jgi:hypothetical protein
VGGVVGWYLQDHADSVVAVVAGDGGLLNRLQYDSFGRILLQSNPSIAPTFAYHGSWREPSLDQPIVGGILYDPSTGRRNQPLAATAGRNAYGLIGANPVGQSALPFSSGVAQVLTDETQGKVLGTYKCDHEVGPTSTDLQNFNNTCTRSCTQAHEGRHQDDVKPCCQRAHDADLKCTSNACRALVRINYKAWFSTNTPALECRGYGVGEKCLESLRKSMKCKEKCPQKGKEQQWKKCCDWAKEHFISEFVQRVSYCNKSATVKPCPDFTKYLSY